MKQLYLYNIIIKQRYKNSGKNSAAQKRSGEEKYSAKKRACWKQYKENKHCCEHDKEH